MAFLDLEVTLPYLLSLSPDGQITPAVLKQAHEGDAGFMVRSIPSNFTSPDSTPDGTIAVNPVLDTNKDGALNPETEIKPGYEALLDTILAPDGELAKFEASRGRPLVIELAPQLTLPVLILQGESDALTSVQGARKLDAALAANPGHTLKIYPGLDHALGPAATLADEKYLPIAQAPLADLVAWVHAQSAKAQTSVPTATSAP